MPPCNAESTAVCSGQVSGRRLLVVGCRRALLQLSTRQHPLYLNCWVLGQVAANTSDVSGGGVCALWVAVSPASSAALPMPSRGG
eukprot:CAMPEP_0181377048 /NCGR_PEP_ID=MMETSP1106-20121128/17669_1 /TAXON_ID=81844 /ORGANISM="Mantoniella antarctica, Strain SL-175" /LENGTH=84 /DNA_ID=CAMNT_0023495717 /DNA_START=758 /DNA_END=1012 /DNA_ORIENTATION=-